MPAAPTVALHKVGGKEEPRASEAELNQGSLSPEEEGLERRGGVKTRGGMVLSSGWGLVLVVGLWHRAKGVTGWALHRDLNYWAEEAEAEPAVAWTRWAPEHYRARTWRA